MRSIVTLVLAASVLAAAPAQANPAAALSVQRASSTLAAHDGRLAGQWRGFPVWSLAVGAVLALASVGVLLFNTDDDQPDSN